MNINNPTTFSAPDLTYTTSNSSGSAGALRADDSIAIFSTNAPSAIASAAATGDDAFAARLDHIHAGVTAITSTDNAIARYNGTGGQLQNYTSGAPTISDIGIFTQPAQPCVLAYPSSNAENATGNGTNYTIALATEVYDQGGNFSSPTFTAPVSGRYFATVRVNLGGLTAAMTRADLTIVTSNRTYGGQETNPGAIRDPNNSASIMLSAVCDMDASDTLSTAIKISNGSGDSVTVHGTSTVYSYLAVAKVA